MAKTVNGAFDVFLRDTVNLDPEQTNKARSSRDWLVGQIQSFSVGDDKFPQNYTDKNIFFGSFSRRTKKRPLDDIDIMICLNANGCTYKELPDKIEINTSKDSTRFLEYVNEGTNVLNSRKLINAFISKLSKIDQYKKSEIKRNQEAATLNLTSYDWIFDIVPCFFTAEDANKKTYYIIPDGSGNWKKTDPRLDNERLVNVNSKHNGNVLNVIRAVKYWNNRPTMPTMPSYLLENMILEYYSERSTPASQYVDVELVNIFNDIYTRVYKVVNDPKGIQGNLNKLTAEEKKKISDRALVDYKKAKEARIFETENKQSDSINKWKEIFGDKFPKYE